MLMSCQQILLAGVLVFVFQALHRLLLCQNHASFFAFELSCQRVSKIWADRLTFSRRYQPCKHTNLRPVNALLVQINATFRLQGCLCALLQIGGAALHRQITNSAKEQNNLENCSRCPSKAACSCCAGVDWRRDERRPDIKTSEDSILNFFTQPAFFLIGGGAVLALLIIFFLLELTG